MSPKSESSDKSDSSPRNLERRPPTLVDVAELAGVSVPTASRVLNGGIRGRQSGSSEKRALVLAAASKLGYSVNPAAQAIVGGGARSVAVIVSDMDDFGMARMIAGAMRAAERYGVSVAVRTTGDDEGREVRILRELRGERHRGIVMATSRTLDHERESLLATELTVLRDQGARIVVIGNSDLPFSRVTVNNRGAARGLAHGLTQLGKRRFTLVAGPKDLITSRDRLEGFIEGLIQGGIDMATVTTVHADFSRDGGFAAVDLLGSSVSESDHIAAMSDAMAVGVIAALGRRGIHVPRDIDVSGFDHVPLLGDVMPTFSTVEVPLERFGEMALSLIFDEQNGVTEEISLRATPVVAGERSS